ncbi:MAG: ACT domain-containing protein [Thermodesulfobacteriota bacterium]
MEKIKIGGIMQSDGRALVRIMSVPNQSGAAGAILGAMGGAGINIELMVQSFDLDDAANFALVVAHKDLDLALTVLEEVKPAIEAKAIAYSPDVAVISVFGPHLREKPRVPGAMFTALAQVGVGSLAIATSISSVSCVVDGPHLEQAINALTEVFDAPFQVKQRPKDY